MRIRVVFLSILAITAVAAFFPVPGAAAQAAAIRVLVSNGMKAAMEQLQPQCERAIGHPLAMQFHSTAAVKKQIEAGDQFDVTIITVEAIDDLTKEGKIAGETRANVARSELGIGIRAGAAKPDIHTAETLKANAARCKIYYLPGGRSKQRLYRENVRKHGHHGRGQA